MLYKHRRTDELYRLILESYSVERQEPSMVYMSLKTGQVFDRGLEKFRDNFEPVHNPQRLIVPKEPHA